jgi:hypothetical protein
MTIRWHKTLSIIYHSNTQQRQHKDGFGMFVSDH